MLINILLIYRFRNLKNDDENAKNVIYLLIMADFDSDYDDNILLS